MTPADLMEMKRQGKKIAAGVVYEAQMTKIFERAGVDLLSVGDSVGRAFLGQEQTDDYTVEEMMTFAKAVARTAERAVVSVDMPTATCKAGPTEVLKAAKRLKEEAGVDMAKVDIRTMEEELIEDVRAVIEAGLGAYPQIGFPTFGGGRGMRSDPEARDHVMKWAHAVEEAGAQLLDLTMVTPDIYAEVVKTMKIPVLGGQAPPEADGKIYVSYGLVGYRFESIDADNNRPSASRFMFDIAKKAIDDIHAGQWASGQPG
jgi:3-methyl-2-oxobutanoate hydroxymethyltransferase